LNLERGGQVAQNLDRFYDAVRANLCEAQFQASKELLARQITDLLTVREAWEQVERLQGANPISEMIQ